MVKRKRRSKSTPEICPREYSEFLSWKERRDTARERLTRLTDRERQIAMLVANHCMNRDIAAHLNLSEKTVEKHRANAYRKAGCDCLVEFVQLLTIADLESPPADGSDPPASSSDG